LCVGKAQGSLADLESQHHESQNDAVPVEHVRRLTSTVVDMLRHLSKNGDASNEERSVLVHDNPLSDLCDDKMSLSSGDRSSIKDSEISTRTALLKAQFLPQAEYTGDEVLPFYMDNEMYVPEDGKGGEGVIPKKLKKNVKINWSGLAVFVLFICAFITYVTIRATKTLGLGGSMWYGVIVLMVEMLGAIAMFPYGVCLSFKVDDPVPKAIEDALKGQTSVTAVNYHIRVVIPCYKEPLEVISKTFMASMYAALPCNCRRTGM